MDIGLVEDGEMIASINAKSSLSFDGNRPFIEIKMATNEWC